MRRCLSERMTERHGSIERVCDKALVCTQKEGVLLRGVVVLIEVLYVVVVI